MNEAFIHYLWKYRMLNRELSTESGHPLVIIKPGEHNTNGGPDFFNARLRVGETLWAGNVEIHVRASDWYKHNHQLDKAYENTILHVVYEPDIPVKWNGSGELQTLVIKEKYPKEIYDRYQMLMKNQLWIPCANLVGQDHMIYFRHWAPSLLVERMVEKSQLIQHLWEGCDRNWEESFYRYLAINFGFRINAFPFELLSRSLPLKLLRTYWNNRFQLESLLFGQAGMLEQDFTDAYPQTLSAEYRFLQAKYRLKSIHLSMWKYLRLRPSNFPNIRLSQFAALINQSYGNLFSILESNTYPEARKCFSVNASNYWDTHFTFDKPSALIPKFLGNTSVNLLMINGVATFLFFYGQIKDSQSLREKAVYFIEQAAVEVNAEIIKWKESGFLPENAQHSQALHQLKNGYCDKKRCLECRIGNKILLRT